MNIESFAGIQYIGLNGISKSCLKSIIRFLQFGDRIHKVKILTHGGNHCLLLTMDYDELVAVKTGLTSGYRGEGPSSFSKALSLLEWHGADIDEYKVSESIINKIDRSCLLNEDIELIESLKPVRPQIWHDYIYEDHYIGFNDFRNYFPKELFPSVMPYSVIDNRLIDLAQQFEQQPDATLLTGFRRLEDIVRKRTGIKEYGSKLFSKAFHGETPILCWPDIDGSEQKGRASLFGAIYMAFRNNRAHNEPKAYSEHPLSEFLLLNQLFILENNAERQIDEVLN